MRVKGCPAMGIHSKNNQQESNEVRFGDKTQNGVQSAENYNRSLGSSFVYTGAHTGFSTGNPRGTQYDGYVCCSHQYGRNAATRIMV